MSPMTILVIAMLWRMVVEAKVLGQWITFPAAQN
jgi:hypothetical protein